MEKDQNIRRKIDDETVPAKIVSCDSSTAEFDNGFEESEGIDVEKRLPQSSTKNKQHGATKRPSRTTDRNLTVKKLLTKGFQERNIVNIIETPSPPSTDNIVVSPPLTRKRSHKSENPNKSPISSPNSDQKVTTTKVMESDDATPEPSLGKKLPKGKRKSGRNSGASDKTYNFKANINVSVKVSRTSEIQTDAESVVKEPIPILRISDSSIGNKSVESSVEIITGDADPELCLIPDDPSSSRLRRPREERRRSQRETKPSTMPTPPETSARPKRNAARAAGTKIKSLVNNSLEAVCLEEVDQPITQQCAHCKRMKLCRFMSMDNALCSEDCHTQWTNRAVDVPFVRSCAQCRGEVREGSIAWETMDFCGEDCLRKYQTALGSFCENCKKSVVATSMGKFCVRFGHEIRQFCCASCLDEFKKGLKFCTYCQKDISSGVEGFLAPVGNKSQFKDFCSQSCMTKYEQMSGSAPIPEDVAECAVCSHRKRVSVEVLVGSKVNKLCSEPCFAAFKFVNSVCEGRCDQCKRYFDKMQSGGKAAFFDDRPYHFCGLTCLNVYIIATRKIMPCGACKVKKYDVDMIKKTLPHGSVVACSLECLSMCQQSGSKLRRFVCDYCLTTSSSQYKVSWQDGTVKHCCSYNCALAYQKRLGEANFSGPGGDSSSETSSAKTASKTDTTTTSSVGSDESHASASTKTVSASTQVFQHILTRPPEPKPNRNKAILCKPYTHNKGTSCRPMPCYKSTQTDESLTRKCLIPVPVPIYIPAPMHMYSSPFPVPTPFPLPVPVPIFIPTTRNSAKGIFKEIKKIQEKIPTDPFEAELLMMAEMVAGEKKQDPTDSESEEGAEAEVTGGESFSPEAVDTSNTFGDDIMQMALKMASELEEPAVDMESVLTSTTITPSAQPTVDSKALFVPDPDETAHHQIAIVRGRKRPMRGARGSAVSSKRGRRSGVDGPTMAPPEPVAPPRLEVEKPDANMCLKYTFGVNAWRHWVMQKNLELEKAAMTNRKIKPFKPDLLQLTADELNFSLCLFVKEVKKPSGQEYAPDTIYYLCLGIQQYLFENGRIDNIFTDTYYEKFTDCLDEVAKKFAALYNDSQFIVTRVEEEHLWESKQLGAHSPHVLLNTLMFFNTKHFNLVTVEEHMQLSFSHIMKHWKRNPNAPGVAKVPGSRNVLLRFYPPQSALEANSRKKKVYEQQENEENPLRCPVKLYEFYLSKCPESVKTRNDVFYLLPERSCVPDSPVWYSTMALGRDPLMKMLHRIKMVKEINVAVLSS